MSPFERVVILAVRVVGELNELNEVGGAAFECSPGLDLTLEVGDTLHQRLRAFGVIQRSGAAAWLRAPFSSRSGAWQGQSRTCTSRTRSSSSASRCRRSSMPQCSHGGCGT